jgi:hypothetical protein
MRTTLVLIAVLAAAPLQAQTADNLKTTNIQRYYMPVRLFLQGAAEVMPTDKYRFKLSPEQMDFGQWINHATERNYLDCSTLRGEPNPMPKAKTDLLTMKDEIIKNLRRSRSSTTRKSWRRRNWCSPSFTPLSTTTRSTATSSATCARTTSRRRLPRWCRR